MIKEAIGIACLIFLLSVAAWLFYVVILKDKMGHKKFVKKIGLFFTPTWKIEGARKIEEKEAEKKEIEAKATESKPNKQ